MKTAVVYYSKNGCTKAAAEVIAQKLSADIFALEEVKKRGNSLFSFIAEGFGGATGKKSSLINTFKQELTEYDKICIGSPVWAGNSVPAINTFVDSLDAKGKEIIVFSVQADDKPDQSSAKCADSIKAALEIKGAVVLQVVKLYGARIKKTANKDDINKQIDAKLT